MSERHIGAKVNQQIFINQGRRALAQTGPAEYARLSTVSTFAESFRESICRGGPKKGDLHQCRIATVVFWPGAHSLADNWL